MSTGTDLAVTPVHKALAGMTGGGIPSLIPQSIDEVWRFSQLLAKSGLTPKGIETPEQVTVQILMGFDLGLKPMQAVQNIAVINGRPAIGGDLALAILMTSGELEDHDEWVEGEGDARVAVCRVQRKGMKPIERRFSVDDAKQAGLWQTAPMIRKSYWDKNLKQRVQSKYEEANDSPWWKYQPRMLCMRARGFAFRDRFADVLKGMHLTEEMIGHEEEQSAPAIAGPSAPPLEEPQAAAPASPVQPAPQPAAPPQEVEEAEVVEVAPSPADGGGVQADDHRPVAGVDAAAPPMAQEESFDPEAWLDEVRDRFAEARTLADVDSVHETFGDTATELLGMTERQRYQDMHEQAELRVQVKDQPEVAEITGQPGPPPAEDDDESFPGNEALQAATKSLGDLYQERIRAAIADPIRTLDSLSGFWSATKTERQQLVNDGHLTRAQVKKLHGELLARWEAAQPAAKDPEPGPSAPPAEEDEATLYDREFRNKLHACATREEVDALSAGTLAERNKRFTGHPLHKTWHPLITQRRKELSGIA